MGGCHSYEHMWVCDRTSGVYHGESKPAEVGHAPECHTFVFMTEPFEDCKEGEVCPHCSEKELQKLEGGVECHVFARDGKIAIPPGSEPCEWEKGACPKLTKC